MRYGTGRPRLTAARRRRAFSGKVQYLESRELLTGLNPIDLGGQVTASGAAGFPAIAVDQTANLPTGTLPTGPFGIDEAGTVASQGAGFSVTDVGDLNGDGYDEYLLGAPMVTNSTGGLALGTPASVTPNSEAYLIYGSQEVNAGNVDWITLHTIENTEGYANGQLRVGNLSQLGQPPAGQTNPINGAQGYAYEGITFETASNPNSQLGAAVSAIPGGINGAPAFLIGAPNAFALNDTTGTTPRTGRAYLIYGNSLEPTNAADTTVNLDAASGTDGAAFITFGANIPGTTPTSTQIGFAGSIGRSLAAIPSFFNDNGTALAFGAPTATFTGVNSGAVYVIAQSAYLGATQIDLSRVGQTNGLNGVIFGGTVSGAYTGVSVANAGNINKSGKVNDLLIGAPGTLNPFTQAPTLLYTPSTYLIYGSNTLRGSATLTNLTSGINLNLIGDPVVTTGDIPGADFTGAVGDALGYSVSTAGDVNDDGYSDFLIGAPLGNYAALIYGQPDLVNGTVNGTTNPILGTIPIDTFPLTEVNPVTGNPATPTGASSAITGTPPPIVGADFNGSTGLNLGAGVAMTGFSVGFSGSSQSATKYSEILIGAPGTTYTPTGTATGPALGDQGEVFIVPGSTYQYGGNLPLDIRVGLQLQFSTSTNQTIPAYFGAAVGGALVQSGQAHTADGDLQSDPIIGAPGYGVITSLSGTPTSMALSGGAFVVQGSNTTIQMDSIGGSLPSYITQVTNQFGIGSLKAPFPVVSATTPTLTFYIYSQKSVNGIAGNNFSPFLGIDTTTIVVNGVPMPATIVSVPDNNNDGIPEAAVTVTGINLLGLINGNNQTLTISGLIDQNNPTSNPFGLLATTSATPLIGEFFETGKVTVINGRTPVTPTPTPSSTSVAGVAPPGLVIPTTYVPQFGNDVYVPTPAALSTFDYAPIAEKVAYKEYKPTAAFVQRTLNYLDPAKYHFQPNRTGGTGNTGRGSNTLGQHVLDTSKYHPGKTIEFTHKVKVVPTNLQHERLAPIKPKVAKKKK